MNPLDKPVTLTLTLQQVSRLTRLLKHHIDELHLEYDIIPEDSHHIAADIAIAEDTRDALQEAMKQ